jgi:hypothetical protein
MSIIIWKRAKQQQLLAELRGFWSEDIWDMRNSPVRTGLTPVARQRYLYFECRAQTINGELKYACWKKFSEGSWRTTSETTMVHRLDTTHHGFKGVSNSLRPICGQCGPTMSRVQKRYSRKQTS